VQMRCLSTVAAAGHDAVLLTESTCVDNRPYWGSVAIGNEVTYLLRSPGLKGQVVVEPHEGVVVLLFMRPSATWTKMMTNKVKKELASHTATWSAALGTTLHNLNPQAVSMYSVLILRGGLRGGDPSIDQVLAADILLVKPLRTRARLRPVALRPRQQRAPPLRPIRAASCRVARSWRH
jgi:hypothetical protein